MERKWLWPIGLGVFGLVNVGNGVWMILVPEHWYYELPAAVPDFGPMNAHFIRDVGAAYVTVGAGLVWGGVSSVARFPALVLATIFYALHAAGHVHDTASGVVGPEHWWIDFPAIYLPTVLLIWAAIIGHKAGRAAAARRA